MATSDVNGLPQFQGSDPADLEVSLNLLSSSASSALSAAIRPFLAANNTARNALATARPPSTSNPLLVWMQNSGKFQINKGDGWRDWPETEDISNFPTIYVPGPNELLIDGTTYTASGTWAVSTGDIKWYTGVKQSTVYLANITKNLPFDLPSGWTVEVFMVNMGNRWVYVSRAGISGRTVTIRMMQLYNRSRVAMTVGWRLTKIS